jgi:hypothetical protein
VERQLYSTLQKPFLGPHGREGVVITGQQTAQWRTSNEVYGIMLKATWHWIGDDNVISDPLGTAYKTASQSSYIFQPYWVLGKVTISHLELVG